MAAAVWGVGDKTVIERIESPRQRITEESQKIEDFPARSGAGDYPGAPILGQISSL